MTIVKTSAGNAIAPPLDANGPMGWFLPTVVCSAEMIHEAGL